MLIIKIRAGRDERQSCWALFFLLIRFSKICVSKRVSGSANIQLQNKIKTENNMIWEENIDSYTLTLSKEFRKSIKTEINC